MEEGWKKREERQYRYRFWAGSGAGKGLWTADCHSLKESMTYAVLGFET